VEKQMTGIGAVIAAVIAFIVTSILGIWMIPFLKRLKYGQSIKEIGPVWHRKKQGTPVMGGILFIAGIAVAVLVLLSSSNSFGLSGMGTERPLIIGGMIMALMITSRL
jgi:phospho-N-acetylmuramoyl-pentapeptide-transferase